MRLSEEKIKAAILDSELNIRQRAIRYFSASFSTDPSIMPLIIKAVDAFGRQDAYHLIGLSRDLPQTAETIAWIIDELNNEQTEQHENYAYNLSMVLVKAEPALLLTKETDILASRHFRPDLRPSLFERLQMLSWDESTCWQKLEEFCEQEKDEQYVNDVNLGYGNRIIEALARYGAQCQGKVHALLSQKIEDYRHNPMNWMEPLAVRLAGKVQLASTVPLIIAKLIEDGGDLMNEACIEALARIGTSAVVEAVAREYPNAPDHFRRYATEPLESIHCDLAVEKCLQLLGKEPDADIRLNLAQALLSHFAPEGIEEARKLLVGRKLNFAEKGLRLYLLETCTLMGERFPEYDEWLAIETADRAEHQKKVEELQDDPLALMKFALEKITGKKMEDIQEPKPRLPPASSTALPHQQAPKQKVGRNDLCPCGSGKKFKKCCLTRN